MENDEGVAGGLGTAKKPRAIVARSSHEERLFTDSAKAFDGEGDGEVPREDLLVRVVDDDLGGEPELLVVATEAGRLEQVRAEGDF